MARKKFGFTMIELLCVIVIVSTLGTTAMGQFLDFRKEARAAVLRQTLISLRSGIKNQIQQALLKCNRSYTEIVSTSFLLNSVRYNDVTTNNGLCTTTQVPNAADRKTVQFNGQGAIEIFYAPEVYSAMPPNPFVIVDLSSPPEEVRVIEGYLGSADTACGMANSPANPLTHWYLDTETGNISAGTNTPGINECNF